MTDPFANPSSVSTYVDETPLKVPGLADLHRMATILVDEHADDTARILVVGAGGGLELRSMAQARAGWVFVGVDPSSEMLAAARRVVAPWEDRIELLQGTVDAAPAGPFGGATCLLVMHFLDRAERLRTLVEIRRRLEPGARLVVLHHCVPDGAPAERWLRRSVAFADRTGSDPQKAAASATEMASRLTILSASEEEASLHEAGFQDVERFHAAFSFGGWVATARGDEGQGRARR